MLLQLITRARRRLFWNALAAEGVRAATIAVALLVLLLLLGTDILGWHWLIAMPAAAFAAGFYFAIRRLPGLYQTARIVDTRLRLYDMLATALFFSRPPSASACDPGMQRAQADRARAASANVHLGDAVPFRAPRLLYAALPLALLACSLFMLRYVWQDQLNLRQPMPAVSRLLVRLSEANLLSFVDRKQDPPKPPDSNRDQERSGKDRAGEGERHDDAARGTPANLPTPSEKQQDGAEKQRNAGQPGEQSAQQQQQQQNSQSQDSQETASNGEPQNGNRDQANQNNTNSSLMSKLSNAVQNMLSRLGSQSNGNRRGESSRSENSNQQNARNGQRSNGQPGMQQSSGQSASASQSGESGQPKQGMQAMGTGKSGESRDRQPGSSAGSNDGAKDVKQAEQLAAMGKLSVVLGQRSDKLTGSSTIETVSGTQTLVTPYSGARNEHAETGALINHDEVPVTVQDYVERYFAAVRSRPERVARRLK